jgi:hypothetical protein
MLAYLLARPEAERGTAVDPFGTLEMGVSTNVK